MTPNPAQPKPDPAQPKPDPAQPKPDPAPSARIDLHPPNSLIEEFYSLLEHRKHTRPRSGWKTAPIITVPIAIGEALLALLVRHRAAATVLAALLLVVAAHRWRLERSDELLRVSCVTHCPFDCRAVTMPATYEQQHLDALVELVAAIPTLQLSSYRALIDHLELVRERRIAPLVAISESWTHTDATSAALSPARPLDRDLDLLIRALYIRALPPPNFGRAEESLELSAHFANDKRVKALVQTLSATERLQMLLSSAARYEDDVLRADINRLAQAAELYEEYLLPVVGSVVYRTREVQRQARLGTESAETAQLLAALQRELLVRIARGAHRPSGPKLDEAPATLAAVFAPYFADGAASRSWSTYQILALGLNNWLDIECLKARLGCGASDVAVVSSITAKLLDKMKTVGRLRQSVLAPLTITHIEYRFLVDPKCRLGSVASNELVLDVQALLRSLFFELEVFGDEGIDGGDVERYVTYLRTGSPYLEGAWTPRQFDSWLIAAKAKADADAHADAEAREGKATDEGI